jgi:uncharacterized membrane protein YeaQ/YmgE (transglycosylase-associated protein family)
MNIIIWILIGGISGWLAGLINKGSGFGFFGNIVVGLIGSVVGGYLFGLFGIPDTNFVGSIIVSTVGAVALLFIVNIFSGRKV